MRIPNDLRAAAITEFEAGGNWQRFIVQHGGEIREAEPFDVGRYRALRSRLLSIVCSGTTDGMFPPGDADASCEWETDDAIATPPDSETSARFNAEAAGLKPMRQTTMFNATEAHR